jgi:hypothetical protein
MQLKPLFLSVAFGFPLKKKPPALLPNTIVVVVISVVVHTLIQAKSVLIEHRARPHLLGPGPERYIR